MPRKILDETGQTVMVYWHINTVYGFLWLYMTVFVISPLFLFVSLTILVNDLRAVVSPITAFETRVSTLKGAFIGPFFSVPRTPDRVPEN